MILTIVINFLIYIYYSFVFSQIKIKELINTNFLSSYLHFGLFSYFSNSS